MCAGWEGFTTRQMRSQWKDWEGTGWKRKRHWSDETTYLGQGFDYHRQSGLQTAGIIERHKWRPGISSNWSVPFHHLNKGFISMQCKTPPKSNLFACIASQAHGPGISRIYPASPLSPGSLHELKYLTFHSISSRKNCFSSAHLV